MACKGHVCHDVKEVITLCLALRFGSKYLAQGHTSPDLPDDRVRFDDSEVNQICCEGPSTQVARVVCPATDDRTQVGKLGREGGSQ